MTRVDVPGGEGTGNVWQAVKTTILSLTLNLGLVDRRTRSWRVPLHHCFLAESLTRRNSDGSDCRRDFVTGGWTRGTADSGRHAARAGGGTAGGISQG